MASTTTQDGAVPPRPSSQDSGSPSQKASRGGEASIEEFGSEAEESERAAILAAFRRYLDAVAAKDYAAICARLAVPVRESFAQFAARGARADCATVLPALLSPSAPQIARAQASGQVTGVRVEGERAFVIFNAPGAELYQQTMVAERGEWRATTLAASVLVPKL